MLKSFINWGGVGWDREVGSYRRVQGHWDLFWGHCRGPDLAVVGSGGGLLGAPTERGVGGGCYQKRKQQYKGDFILKAVGASY